MKFNVPIQKGNDFPILFFEFFAYEIQNIAAEYQKWPDKVTFLGRLGQELYDIIIEKKWDFSRFNISHQHSPVNKIIIEYSKPLDEIEDRGYIKAESLNGQTMNGIPGNETVSKLKDFALNTSFKIERKIRPKLEIKLIR